MVLMEYGAGIKGGRSGVHPGRGLWISGIPSTGMRR